MSQRAVAGAGVAVAAAAGYYLYQSGGDPKVAEKKLECMHPMRSFMLEGQS